MKKLLLLSTILLFAINTANAGILTNTLRNNGYYYPPQNAVRYRRNPYYYNNYNNYRYHQHPYGYYNRYPQNYYNQQPVILRSRVRRSMNESNEKNVSYPFSGIDKLEKQLLFQTFEYDNPKNRIERLEQKIFGASQQGSLEERLFVLKSAAKNYKAFNPDNNFSYSQNSYNSNYGGYRPPLFTGSTGSNWRNMLLGNFRNQFAGTPTGFTPAMDPAYMDWFEAERAMMGSGDSVDYRTNYGYHRSNTNRGATTGVTILD